MRLDGILPVLRVHPEYKALLENYPSGKSLGVNKAARPILTAALALDSADPIFVLTATSTSAYNLSEQILAWAPSVKVLTFVEPGPRLYERAPWGTDAVKTRLEVLTQLVNLGLEQASQKLVVVSSAAALMRRTVPPAFLKERMMNLQQGTPLPFGAVDQFLRGLLQLGYQPATVVVEPGTFSRRGGIIDLFPLAATLPLRIELWGDDIDSMRAFDPESQRSLQAADDIPLLPASEALPEFGPDIAEHLSPWFEAYQITEESDPALNPRSDFESLQSGTLFPRINFYLPYMYSNSASLIDYLPDSTRILVDQWDHIRDTFSELEENALKFKVSQEARGTIPTDMPLPMITWGQVEDDLTYHHAVELGHSTTQIAMTGLNTAFSSGDRFAGQLKTFIQDLGKRAKQQDSQMVVVSRQAARLAELWVDYQGHAPYELKDHVLEVPEPGLPIFVNGGLTEGWVLKGNAFDTLVFSDQEVFGWQRPEPRRRARRRAPTPEATFADLQPNDFVVHSEYGIGQFQGLEKRQLKDVEREFLVLTYHGGNVLYVPIHQADRITRYIGADDSNPELTKLGTQDWLKAKTRTQQAVEELAEDLLELYAQREAVQGYAFQPDTAWQHELEASFPYVETQDQLSALHEVKADMESQRPMDRLICGDVGYGKTEVALRAAFKAVMDGKQVAMLVPTTVLAQQHFETLRERMAAFPVGVEMLSRFRTPSEQAKILAKMQEGTVDIVVGTHRLLGNDIHFADLGLLIIDEEQRFGVTHKEKLKQLRTEVDVLTLTATPIPRTLYMSLTGIRDISIITTAPQERLPIATHVGRRDNDLIRQAIMREVERNGQAFFVHNRVKTIYAELERLSKLIPEARFAVGHGQMSESELEAVMSQFASGDVDVLLTTTIIEAGLDIPNANTLIIDRADRFGLSQLHQLRGRVGRAANLAYAYFFHPGYSRLTAEARARLDTIAEETNLGAGMNIAMRDLEIRGAGDILSGKQHGHISTVGFHLYTRMLAQAVKRLRANREETDNALPELEGDIETLAQRGAVTIDLPVPTYLPTDYIPDLSLRVNIYRRMADIHSESDIQQLRDELIDRFGTPPAPVEGLLYQLQVKNLGLDAGVDAVLTEGEQLNLRIPGLAFTDRNALQERIGHNVRVSRTGVWLPRENGWQQALLSVLKQINIERYREIPTN